MFFVSSWAFLKNAQMYIFETQDKCRWGLVKFHLGLLTQTINSAMVTVYKIEFGFGRFDNQKRTIIVRF
jgi:hypothetical protein